MNVAGLLAEVGLLGGTVKFQPVESKLIVDVPEGFPDALVQRLRVNKQEIIHHINKGRYEPAYLHPNQRDYELMELVRRVEEEGYVLLGRTCWTTWCLSTVMTLIPPKYRRDSCRTPMMNFTTCSVTTE